jgi:hypothetical protein
LESIKLHGLAEVLSLLVPNFFKWFMGDLLFVKRNLSKGHVGNGFWTLGPIF